ncbi:MAG TPA: UbiH/UbiF family hydroxylase [Burkholderiales bacterium]|nr:UbiH/UbiF family hydroxylase [Burkholderiales bacterium]
MPPSISTDFDVLIAGAGLVGASFALALRDSGLRVGIIEPAEPSPPGEAWDSRIYALNPANIDFLQTLGAWQRMDPARLQPVGRMQIYGDDQARLDFSAYESGVAALAYILESGRLQYALWESLRDAPNIELLTGARCADADFESAAARIRLDDGRTLRTELLVGADGANSWVRRVARLQAQVHAYEHLGVVANFDCAKPHGGTAFQWFRHDGILAYLPLAGQRMSMVWSTPDEHGRELLALPHEQLAARVAEAGRHVLGELRVITPPQAFPLRKMRLPDVVAPRVALIGDAAHVVHPLAGQGVNLGFGDAAALARLIIEREPFRRCGDMAILRRYQRERAEPVAAMGAVTHGLQRLFAAPGSWVAALRNRGLAYTDRTTVIKNLLVRQALG